MELYKNIKQTFLTGLLFIASVQFIYSDCGSVPFPIAIGTAFLEGLIIDKNDTPALNYDPLQVRVYEPGQRAIVLWNGEEETLLLSTNQKATERAAILEVIPLPAEPTVSIGDFETFNKAQKTVLQKRMWACAHGGVDAGKVQLPEAAGKITFHQQLGAHGVTIAQALNSEGFVEFVQKFLKDKYKTNDVPIREEFKGIIKSYIDKGFKWFVFDVIMLDDEVQSRQPIEYKFKSDCVYYPLNISSLELGNTKLELMIFSQAGIKDFSNMPKTEAKIQPKVNVTIQEMNDIKTGWGDFFTNEISVVADEITIEGESVNLTADIKVK